METHFVTNQVLQSHREKIDNLFFIFKLFKNFNFIIFKYFIYLFLEKGVGLEKERQRNMSAREHQSS